MSSYLYFLLDAQLSGCKRSDAEDLHTAKASCEELAEAKYPVKNQIAQGTHYESIQEKCTDKSKCGGKSIGRSCVQLPIIRLLM